MTREEKARYYTGPAVVENSVALQLGGERGERARAFFDARSALGITGYMTEAEALERLA